MKMQPDRLEGVNVVTRQEPGRLWVLQAPHTTSILVPHRGEVRPWAPASFDQLEAEHFDAILALKPELVILGTGSRLRFPRLGLWKGLMAAGIGFEAMDTGAACRTYNVLASEGRAALAALLIEREPG